MTFFIYSVSAGKKEDTLLYNKHKHDYDIVIKENNKISLAKRYNNAIDFAIQEKFDCLVLCHDDITIDSNLNKKIPELLSKYDVVGVAGCSEFKLEEPCLWHIMGQKAGQGKLHGAVAHYSNIVQSDEKFMTSFGIYPHRASLIDGVFMCISSNAFTKVRFDEDSPSRFHFYDLDYSLQCYKEKIRVGVGDIMISHASHGLRAADEEFEKGQEWFWNKWKSNL
jgi:GT2 family glycosyltransferase